MNARLEREVREALGETPVLPEGPPTTIRDALNLISRELRVEEDRPFGQISGVHIHLPNHLIVSVQCSPINYCSNRPAYDDPRYTEIVFGYMDHLTCGGQDTTDWISRAKTAEVAVIDGKGGCYLTDHPLAKGDDVMGWVSPTDLLQIVDQAALLQPRREP